MSLEAHCHQVCTHLHTNLARYPIAAVGLPLVGGFLTAYPAHRHVKGWYEALKKPEWAAPACSFVPTWAALYLSLGYASHLVALRTGPNTLPSIRGLAQHGLCLYSANLALNFAWSPIMFWKQKIGAALATLVGTTATAIGLSFYFFKVDKCAGYLTLPYVAWLSYATALNYDIWIKNAQGPTADSARNLGKNVNEAAQHLKDDVQHAADAASAKAKKVAKDIHDTAEHHK